MSTNCLNIFDYFLVLSKSKIKTVNRFNRDVFVFMYFWLVCLRGFITVHKMGVGLFREDGH